ncbi:MAG: cytochrome C oxidase subunit IV family protein [Myxococcota bacterium]
MASHAQSSHGHAEHGDDYHHHQHISTIRTNGAVFAGLLFFTALTILAYRFRLGEYNLLVALIIASMKASLVCTWFMHLKYEARFNVLFFLGSVLFLSVFVGYTVNDTGHRGRNQTIQGRRVDPATGAYAHGTADVIANNPQGQAFETLPPAPPPPAGQ